MNKPARRRFLTLAAVLLACALGLGGYAVHAVRRAGSESAPMGASMALAPLRELPAASREFMLYRHTGLGGDYGKIALVYLDDLDGTRVAAPLECDRVHYARGTGVCLQATRSALTTYRALLFDDHFAIRKVFDLAGPPSRARVSPDGRRAAFTVFISGQAYSGPGFTTRTSIVDAVTGEMLVADLETWPVTRDGTTFRSPDFNFWGVTFAQDGNRFFATLASAGHTYLVQGNLTTRELEVVHGEVECPSLSPDESRIAYKRREPPDAQGRVRWSLAVLELANGKVTPLMRETRNVDDQVEWVDSRRVAYALPKEGNRASAESDIWAIDVGGAAAPKRLVSFAVSPAAGHRQGVGETPASEIAR